MQLLINPCRSPGFNLAVEEYLLRHGTDEFFIIWRNSPAIICGRGQNIYEEADICAARELGVELCRRFSGGGTVYHDDGNINYTVIRNYGGELDFESQISPLVAALHRLGVDARLSSVSDITLNGRKISGNAQARVGNRLLHHGTLLYDADLGLLRRLAGDARRPAAAFESRSVKSRVASVANIKELLGARQSTDEFESSLREALFPGGRWEALDRDAVSGAEALNKEKYSTWEWICGSSPRFRFDADGVAFTSYHGKIESIGSGLPESLLGARLDLSELSERGLSSETAEFIITGRRPKEGKTV